MHSAKEKVSNMASAAEEHVDIYKAKVEEKVEKAAARTKEEKDIAQELRKAKEAEAKMKLHEAKAEHAADKLHAKHSHHHLCGDHNPTIVGAHGRHHHPVGTTAVPMAGTTNPTYPLGGHAPGHHHNKYM
ncbi:Late embryogenesis abundant protein 6 [Camellia lanceoleosa]|uniref:Late embryogenesis abundant protein 6 n=1 Tax=Camellia lanceoleosa TaxID=1840588 RepID=A0ACC0G2C8_9ERIC|nr:Late embryogenesis abundant protein 6 [Camellia lanceoleosa]